MALGSVNVPGDLSGYQSKLTGLPGQAAVFDSAGKVAAANWLSNESLLDNWYFPKPVNQLGKEVYTEQGYSIDRWCLGSWNAESPSATITSEGIRLKSTTAANTPNSTSISQRVEDYAAYAGKTLTFSVLYKNNSSTSNVVAVDDGVSVSYAGQFKTEGLAVVTATLSDSHTKLEVFVGHMASYGGKGPDDIVLIAAKLELGDRQTLAHQDENGNWVLNDPPPNKALELAKCQRYFYRMEGHINGTLVTFPLFVGAVYRPNQADGMITFPVAMAKNPAFSYECDGAIRAFHMNGTNHPCSISTLRTTPYGALMRATTDGANDLLDLGSVFVEASCHNFCLDFDANL